MPRQVLPLIDLRSPAERQGITKTQQTTQSIANILQTIGQGEKVRRDRQTLDRVVRAISSGKTNIEAIAKAARQGPEFGTGFQGGLQRIGGLFRPQGGGIEQSILQSIVGQALKQALAPKIVTRQAKANLQLTKARTEALRLGKNTIKDLMTEGYTAEEAKHIRDISHGLKPRASAIRSLEQKPLAEQLSFWQTVYNKTLDPEWGSMRPTTDMDAARELAKQNMERITAEMRQSTQATKNLPGFEPSGLEDDLENAMSAIKSGAPPEQVYERLIQAYPDSEDEIRRLLGL